MAQGYAVGQPQVRALVGVRTSTSAAINTTETIIVPGTRQLVANQLQVGSTIRTFLQGTCTSTAANTSTFRVRFGATGTTADASIFTGMVATAATTGTAIAFTAIIEFTVRTIGASATAGGVFTVINNGTTGICATVTLVVIPTFAALNTTAAGFFTVSYQSSATTTTSTFYVGTTELL